MEGLAGMSESLPGSFVPFQKLFLIVLGFFFATYHEIRRLNAIYYVLLWLPLFLPFRFPLSLFESPLLIIVFPPNSIMLAVCYFVRWDKSVKANFGEKHTDLNSFGRGA